MRTDQHAFSGELNWDLGWGDLTSITAYRYWHFDPLQDSDTAWSPQCTSLRLGARQLGRGPNDQSCRSLAPCERNAERAIVHVWTHLISVWTHVSPVDE